MTETSGGWPPPGEQPERHQPSWANPTHGTPQQPEPSPPLGNLYPPPPPYYPPVGAQPGYGGAQQRYNPLAITGFVLALVPFFAPLTQILGIIFGHIARSQIRRTGERGAGFALAALLIGYIGGALLTLLLIASIALPILLEQGNAARIQTVQADVRATVQAVQQYNLGGGYYETIPQQLVVKTGGSTEHIVITGGSDDFVVLGSDDLVGSARTNAYYYSALSNAYTGYGDFQNVTSNSNTTAPGTGDGTSVLQRGTGAQQVLLLH